MLKQRKSLLSLMLENPGSTGGILIMAFVSAAILVNATIIQKGRHPAPLFESAAPAGDDGARKTMSESRHPAVARIKPAKPAPRGLVRDIQLALSELKMYQGSVDGLTGPKTRDAIVDYQRRNRMELTGRASPSLLAHIRMNTGSARAVPVPARSPAARAVAAGPKPALPRPKTAQSPKPGQNKDKVRAIQKALSQLGYGPVQVDGQYGSNTAAAIQRFELDRGLSVTGEISPVLVAELKRIGGMPAIR